MSPARLRLPARFPRLSSPPVLCAAGLLAGLLGPAAAGQAAPPDGTEQAADFVRFEQDFAGHCVARNGVQVLVRSSHPSRTLKVVMERQFGGRPTGDRSRSELKPGAEPEPLGCSVSSEQPQAWRVLRAEFAD